MSTAPPPSATADNALEQSPTAIRPPHTLPSLNGPIPLYDGPTTVIRGGDSFQTGVSITLDWLPTPRIRFHAAAVNQGSPVDLGQAALRLPDGTDIPTALVTGIGPSGSGTAFAEVSGLINSQVVSPRDASAAYALFLLPNYRQPLGTGISYPSTTDPTTGKTWHRSAARRLVFTAPGWRITLDGVDGARDAEQTLDAASGFLITQVGKIERADGATFTAHDAHEVLDGFARFVAFTGGQWTGPCIPRGYDASGNPVWVSWNYWRTAPYHDRLSWLDRLHGAHAEEAYRGFSNCWASEDWRSVINQAIHWYVEANTLAGSVEGSIVLTQTALELLASAVLVDDRKWLSGDGYEKLTAADRNRLLFGWAGIPGPVPAELPDLAALARAENWPDVAAALPAIRNLITHPTKKNRDRLGRHPVQVRTEAWTLGLWALELSLLRVFGYTGSYANRITRQYTGQVEPVPWACQSG